MSSDIQFTKDNINKYLNVLAKEYKRRNRKAGHVELILVGGASVIINYGFRDMTTDIDAIILADSIMKESIYAVAEKEGLPDDWLNADFKRSDSYSEKLIQYSVYYRTFANFLEVRTVKAEYLVAMKLVAGRNYKRDLSDIVGILAACEDTGENVTFDKIDKALDQLYGGWERVDDETAALLEAIMKSSDKRKLYETIQKEEDKNKGIRMAELKKRI